VGRLRGSRFPRISNGALRRKVSWEEGPLGAVTAITTSSTAVFPTGQAALLDDLTLVRTRGSLIVQLNALDLSNEGFTWYFGMCVVTENAAAVGITAIPTPLADIAWDGWFMHETGMVVGNSGTLTDPNNAPIISERRPLDSRGMRKLHRTDVIVAVLETTEKGDGSNLSAHLVSRMLVKLP